MLIVSPGASEGQWGLMRLIEQAIAEAYTLWLSQWGLS